MFMFTSSSKSTHSPAAYCFSNDVSVWVAPALIKAGANQTEMLLLKQHAAGDHELLDDYDVPVRSITETCLHLVEFRSWQSCEHSRSDSQKGENAVKSQILIVCGHCPGCQFNTPLFYLLYPFNFNTQEKSLKGKNRIAKEAEENTSFYSVLCPPKVYDS